MVFKKSQIFCLIVVAVAYYYKTTISQKVGDGPVISTKLGKVQGASFLSRGGRKVYGYMKIPYAMPPVGNRRFEPPEPAAKWDGVLDAREYGPRCLQLDGLLGVVEGSEDCLHLNVFTPVETAYTNQRGLPVVVYFHGGFFHNGGSDFWHPQYWIDEDVLFVSFNYRLAALGFLNTGDSEIRGNMGLKDQVMALRWIQENIRFFGGDSNRVTLLGESAGGVCSHSHMFSKMSRGLFNNVISQSGSALHFWAINDDPKRQAVRYAELVGCPNNDTAQMKACLKSLDAEQIIDGHSEMLDPLRDSLAIFKPSIEVDIDDGNTFLSEPPLEMAKRGDFEKKAWATGVNSDEGLIISTAMLVNKTIQTVAEEDWTHFIQRTLWYPTSTANADKIKDFYFGDVQQPLTLLGSESDPTNLTTAIAIREINLNPFEKIQSYTNMISDRGFFYDTHKGASLQSLHAPVHLYYYSYISEWSVVQFFPEISGTFSRKTEVMWSLLKTWASKNIFGMQLPNYGASHSDELSLLFFMPWISEIYPESQDYEMSIDLVKLWADFARDESQPTFKNVDWPVVNSSQHQPLQYLNIDTHPSIIDEPFTHRLQFWSTLLK